MFLFIGEGFLGRIFMISNHFSKANNSYLPKQVTSYLMYLDATNPYG